MYQAPAYDNDHGCSLDEFDDDFDEDAEKMAILSKMPPAREHRPQSRCGWRLDSADEQNIAAMSYFHHIQKKQMQNNTKKSKKIPKIEVQNQDNAVIEIQSCEEVGDDYINCVAVANRAGWASHCLTPDLGLLLGFRFRVYHCGEKTIFLFPAWLEGSALGNLIESLTEYTGY